MLEHHGLVYLLAYGFNGCVTPLKDRVTSATEKREWTDLSAAAAASALGCAGLSASTEHKRC